jgi:hypothetical protein
MADAADSKSVARKGVWVQVPPPVFVFQGFFTLGSWAAPEDKLANPFRTHNSGLGKRIRMAGRSAAEPVVTHRFC